MVFFTFSQRISKQINFTIRYIIQKEISENGITNLQKHILAIRDKDF